MKAASLWGEDLWGGESDLMSLFRADVCGCLSDGEIYAMLI